MNKKDLNYLKRNFKGENNRFYIRKLAKGYGRVDAMDKMIVALDLIDFDEIDAEEQDLYFASAKKALAGKIGKNLHELDLEDQEKKKELMDLAENMWDEEHIRPFLEEILQSQQESGNYFINAFQCALNPAGRADQSAIHFFVVVLHKAKPVQEYLYYDNTQKKVMRNQKQDMTLTPNVLEAIVYPIYDQGSANVSSILYQSGNQPELNQQLIEEILKAKPVMEAKAQQQAFLTILDEVSEGSVNLDQIKSLRQQVEFIHETSDPSMEEPSLDSLDLAEVLKATGIEEEKLADLDDLYREQIGEERLLVDNIIPSKKMNFKMEGIQLSAAGESIDRISKKTIDGKECLVIELQSDLEVDGIPVSQ